MTQHRVAPTVAMAIAQLYEETGVPLPTPDQCIVPLGDLVGNYNLTCTELPKLTGETAAEFLVRQGSILAPPENVDGEKLAGFLYATAMHGSIFVERGDRMTRRRFSIAHELGHYLLHFRPYFASLAADDEARSLGAMETFPSGEEEAEPHQLPQGDVVLNGSGKGAAFVPSIQQMEREANQFAGELLMPVDVIAELVNRYSPEFRGSDLIWRLATDMLVSRAAMRWRLRDLGLLIAPDNELN